jgi:hypothetical protein
VSHCNAVWKQRKGVGVVVTGSESWKSRYQVVDFVATIVSRYTSGMFADKNDGSESSFADLRNPQGRTKQCISK